MRIRIKLITIQVEKDQVLVPSFGQMKFHPFRIVLKDVQSEMINYNRILNKLLQIKEFVNFFIISM